MRQTGHSKWHMAFCVEHGYSKALECRTVKRRRVKSETVQKGLYVASSYEMGVSINCQALTQNCILIWVCWRRDQRFV